MRCILLLTVLIAVQSTGVRAEPLNDCQGEVWRKIEAGMREDSGLKQTVGFLRDEGLSFDSIELVDHAYEPRVKAYIADGINPGCAIYVSEWLPLKESEIKCFPFATRTLEFISIDFDTNARLIGLKCSSGIVKMSCEDARRSLHSGLERSYIAERSEQSDGLLDGLPLPRPSECAAIHQLN